MRLAWVEHANPYLPQTLLAVATGATLIRNALSTKNARTTIASDANPENA